MGFQPVSISLGGLSGKDDFPSYVTRLDLMQTIEFAESRFSNMEINWPFNGTLIRGWRPIEPVRHALGFSDWIEFYNAWLQYFKGDARVAFIHPWQEGVGYGNGIHKTLSAKNVIDAMANKLRDDKDRLCPSGDTEVISVVFSSATLIDLASLVDSFSAVFPFPELAMIKRLSLRMASYDLDSVKLSEPVTNPQWVNVSSEKMQALRNTRAISGAQMAMLDGSMVENEERVELQGLIARKRAYLESIEQAQDELINAAPGGGGQYFYSKAQSPKLCADALINANDFDHSDVYSAGLLLAGAPGELDALKEAFGL
ncbi:hypothetical protein R50076_15720 [Gilvimarinus japonicus]